jgi:hypothetical protein
MSISSLLLVVVLSLELCTASPAKNAAAQPATQGILPGRKAAELPRIKNLIREICDFHVLLLVKRLWNPGMSLPAETGSQRAATRRFLYFLEGRASDKSTTAPFAGTER